MPNQPRFRLTLDLSRLARYFLAVRHKGKSTIAKLLPTLARVRELFRYDKSNGVLIRLIGVGRTRAGDVAGSKRGDYIAVGIDGQDYHAHRVMWLLATGMPPSGLVDHKDRNGHNNRWKNLRDATHSLNAANSKMYASNKTGFKGVSMSGDKFRAQIFKNGKCYHIGRFDTALEASAAYSARAFGVFGEFAKIL